MIYQLFNAGRKQIYMQKSRATIIANTECSEDWPTCINTNMARMWENGPLYNSGICVSRYNWPIIVQSESTTLSLSGTVQANYKMAAREAISIFAFYCSGERFLFMFYLSCIACCLTKLHRCSSRCLQAAPVFVNESFHRIVNTENSRRLEPLSQRANLKLF